jgi:hypothetical protein
MSRLRSVRACGSAGPLSARCLSVQWAACAVVSTSSPINPITDYAACNRAVIPEMSLYFTTRLLLEARLTPFPARWGPLPRRCV